MPNISKQALSPLDDRYQDSVFRIGYHLSEAALNKSRLHIEVEWLIFISENNLFHAPRISQEIKESLRNWVKDFNDAYIEKLKDYEKITQHDVKAVEYLLREKLDELGLSSIKELSHICCTSEDINNLAYSLNIKTTLQKVWLPKFNELLTNIYSMAEEYSEIPMLSRTHGQPATPTTLGKEMLVFYYRLQRQMKFIEETEYLGKFSGATGTWSAHLVVEPEKDWYFLSKKFIEKFGLKFNPVTTQIEPHDWQAELYSRVIHVNRILHNLSTDIWSYISINYFSQIPVSGATGSSTMPHKINPIKFENAEANIEISNAIFESLSSTLVTSRLQRDLTDSSSQRNIGVAFGHSYLAIKNIINGLKQITPNKNILNVDLENNWEVLAEAIQTVIRTEIVSGKSSIQDPYQKLKDLTRGNKISKKDIENFIKNLDISQDAKNNLLMLSPHNYIGISKKLHKKIT